MNVVLFIFVVLCWVSASALSNNKEPKGKELSNKADGALPNLHIVFDTASEEDGAQILSEAARAISNKLQNAAQNFDTETMMSVSTFSGSDSGNGNYLKVLSQPINVLQNNRALVAFIQSVKVTNDTARDPGAAMRDALSSSLGLISPGARDILYLVSRRYVESGPTVKEIDMIDSLLGDNMTLICVEGSRDDTNSIFNLNRISRLTDGYHYTNTPDQGSSWRNINGQAADKLVALSKEPINSIRRMIGLLEYRGVADVPQNGSLIVTPELGSNSFIIIQSSQKGIVTVALTNIQTGVTDTLTTKGGTNWNMINTNLYVDDLDFPSGDSRGRWTYSLTFKPDNDALDTKSDLVIFGLSTENTNPLDYLPFVWASNYILNFPDQNSTTIYAEVIGSVGVLTGLSVNVTFKNLNHTSSEDVSIILTEEVQGVGLYSGIFTPPSDGLYDFIADFKADADSTCTGDLCAPSNFSASVPGQNQIQFQGKDMDTTSTSDISSTSSDGSTNDSSSNGLTSESSSISSDGSTNVSTEESTTDSSTISSDGLTSDSTSGPSTISSVGSTNDSSTAGVSSTDSSTVSSDGPTNNPTTDDTTNVSASIPTDNIPTELLTSSPTEGQTDPTSSPTGLGEGLIIGLSVGFGLLAVILLLILIYFCFIAKKKKYEERGSSIYVETDSITSRRNLGKPKWQFLWTPSAMLRKPSAYLSSYLPRKSTRYKPNV